MDQQGHGQSSGMNYGSNPYQTNPMTAAAAAAAMATGQLAYHQTQQQQQQQQLAQQLQAFWENQYKDIEKTTDFKNHSLPLARIKKIMKADEDVRMISAEAPVVFARACEMFILELTLRSWNHTEENKRRTLQKNDIAAAVTRTDIFDFLVDIVPREDLRDEVLGTIPRGTIPEAAAAGYPYGYLPAATAPIGNPGMVMGNPSAYPSNPYMAQPMWQQQGHEQQETPEN
ncbi:PREDICTED: nuclear transcription factor Y subunit C-9 [Tarenaya hassleriana]|uniref:nuclear transcription factor Y subunit C-9 n=1 Tax=Tarenaya hassleriana TaxID=28532 RepID=UPI00053CA7D5|nr:PREDICTED: nuclear transcription factor Y subunit C-9 [Tarenaya hassleriana]